MTDSEIMTDSGMLSLIREAVAAADPELAGVEIDIGSRLEDVGVDSIAMLEAVGFLEDRLDVELPDSELASVRDVAGLVGLIRARLPAAARAAS